MSEPLYLHSAIARHGGGTLSMQSFRNAISGEPSFDADAAATVDASAAAAVAAALPDPLPTLDQLEEAVIDEALRRADHNQGVAAALLGISRQALNKRLVRRREAAAAARSGLPLR